MIRPPWFRNRESCATIQRSSGKRIRLHETTEQVEGESDDRAAVAGEAAAAGDEVLEAASLVWGEDRGVEAVALLEARSRGGRAG